MGTSMHINSDDKVRQATIHAIVTSRYVRLYFKVLLAQPFLILLNRVRG